MHTLNPSELGRLMLPPKDSEWGKDAVEKQIRLIDHVRGRVPVKVNTCVGETEKSAIALVELVKKKAVSWRLMNVLEIPERSYASLARACEVIGATAVRASVISGSSSCSIDMKCHTGFCFKLKLIQPHFLESMCANCDLRTYSGCYEFAYGPRVEMERGMLMVRNCVHRDGPPFSLPVHAYLTHPMAQQLENILQ